MARYQKRIDQHLSGGDTRKVELVRTKTTEPLVCKFAFAVSRCTRHSLKLIPTVSEWSVRYRHRLYYHRHTRLPVVKRLLLNREAFE